MSNLHKDLANDQIHNPKDFSTAANSTKLTKNASGNLEWIADSGAGGGVSQITGGTGNVTIVSNARNYVNHNFEGSAVNMATGTEWGLGNAQYNSEHKFVINLGSPQVSAITPKNAVSSASWIATEQMNFHRWSGWIYGANGTNITLSMLLVKMTCPFPIDPAPSEVDICRIASLNLALTGNNTPICWNVSGFEMCEGFSENIEANDIVVCSAYSNTGESASFNFKEIRFWNDKRK